MRWCVFHIHPGQGRDLQALLSLVVGAVVELVHTLGVLAALLTEAAIHRRNEERIPGKEVCQTQTVELYKIKLPPESSGIDLFVSIAVAAQVTKVGLAA
jgi:hypothetical protein